jgi:hypothetical protein
MHKNTQNDATAKKKQAIKQKKQQQNKHTTSQSSFVFVTHKGRIIAIAATSKTTCFSCVARQGRQSKQKSENSRGTTQNSKGKASKKQAQKQKKQQGIRGKTQIASKKNLSQQIKLSAKSQRAQKKQKKPEHKRIFSQSDKEQQAGLFLFFGNFKRNTTAKPHKARPLSAAQQHIFANKGRRQSQLKTAKASLNRQQTNRTKVRHCRKTKTQNSQHGNSIFVFQQKQKSQEQHPGVAQTTTFGFAKAAKQQATQEQLFLSKTQGQAKESNSNTGRATPKTTRHPSTPPRPSSLLSSIPYVPLFLCFILLPLSLLSQRLLFRPLPSFPLVPVPSSRPVLLSSLCPPPGGGRPSLTPFIFRPIPCLRHLHRPSFPSLVLSSRAFFEQASPKQKQSIVRRANKAKKGHRAQRRQGKATKKAFFAVYKRFVRFSAKVRQASHVVRKNPSQASGNRFGMFFRTKQRRRPFFGSQQQSFSPRLFLLTHPVRHKSSRHSFSQSCKHCSQQQTSKKNIWHNHKAIAASSFGLANSKQQKGTAMSGFAQNFVSQKPKKGSHTGQTAKQNRPSRQAAKAKPLCRRQGRQKKKNRQGTKASKCERFVFFGKTVRRTNWCFQKFARHKQQPRPIFVF